MEYLGAGKHGEPVLGGGTGNWNDPEPLVLSEAVLPPVVRPIDRIMSLRREFARRWRDKPFRLPHRNSTPATLP